MIEKCKKPFLYEGKWYCGYAYPGEPECNNYDKNSEPLHIKHKSGEKTMHRYCKQKQGEESGAKASGSSTK